MAARNERNGARLISRHHSFFAALAVAGCAMIFVSAPAGGQETTSAPAVPHAQDSTVGLGNYHRATKEEKLASCMDLWDPATHMTKKRWRAVCKRVQTDD